MLKHDYLGKSNFLLGQEVLDFLDFDYSGSSRSDYFGKTCKNCFDSAMQGLNLYVDARTGILTERENVENELR